jgi:hypothetical protein
MDFIIENCKGNNNKKSNSKIDLKKELWKLKNKNFTHYCQFRNEVIFNIKLSNLSTTKKNKINKELNKNQNLSDKNKIINNILNIIK